MTKSADFYKAQKADNFHQGFTKISAPCFYNLISLFLNNISGLIFAKFRYYVAVAQRPKFKQNRTKKCPYFNKGIIFYKCILQNSTYFSITHFSVFF